MIEDHDRDAADWIAAERAAQVMPRTPSSGPIAPADRPLDPRPEGAPTPTRC